MLNPFLAGSNATAAAVDAAFDVTRLVWQAADQTVNNSATLISSSYLTLTVTATTAYILEAGIFYDTNSTADFKNSLLVPVSCTVVLSPWGSDTSAAGVSATIEHDAFTSPTWATGGIAVGTQMCSRPMALISTGAASGSITFQFAQNVANVSNTSLKIGSWMRLTRVN